VSGMQKGAAAAAEEGETARDVAAGRESTVPAGEVAASA
jgi:hypothetical protein